MILRCARTIKLPKLIKQLHPRHSNREINSYRSKSDSSCVNDCSGVPATWPSGNKVNYEFHPETEAIFNQQINAELTAFYAYLSMAAYFGRVDVALPGCESFFAQMHAEEHEHAMRCVNYIRLRGGSVYLSPIVPPNDQQWKCPLNAFKVALQLEIDVTDKLVQVNAVAMKHGDAEASDFIVTKFLGEQMESVSEISRFVTILSGIGDQSLARFIFDKDLLEKHVQPKFNVLKKKRRK